MRKWMLCFVLMATGCGGPIEIAYCDSAEGCDSAGSGLETCPTGTLGYVPTRTDVEPIAFALEVSGMAARLPPFGDATKCGAIIVGFATVDGCSIPSKGISLIDFDSDEPIPAELPPGGTIDHLIPTGTISEPVDGITEVKFHIPSSHRANAYPIVGIVSHPGACSVGFDTACKSNAVIMNYKGQWSELDGTSLYSGLADCEP